MPEVRVGGVLAPPVIASDSLIVARVPAAATGGATDVSIDSAAAPAPLEIGVQIAENLHPVCNPALDDEGNIIVTLSGSRGQKTPVSLFKLDANYTLKAWGGSITNPSGLALDRTGTLFASSRHEGAVFRVAPSGEASLYAEGLGVATGIAFDPAGDLYVGDRSGTVFKIDGQRNTFVFATLEPSVAAYHLAFGPDEYLYVTGPSTSSFDTIWRISPRGRVEPFFRGLGRPQGLAFEVTGALLVVASFQGRRGVVRITPEGKASWVLSGQNLVGLALTPPRPNGRGAASLVLASHNSLYHLSWPVAGWPLLPGRGVR